MSAHAARAGAHHLESGLKIGSSQDACDDFYSWVEVENREASMSIIEAAALLSVDHAEAVKMINEGTLCAVFDDTMQDWLVKTACVRAQLAETVPLAADQELSSTKLKALDGDESSSKRDKRASKKDKPHAPLGTESGAHLPGLRPLDRAAITAASLERIIDSFDFANARLESAMHRVGYLEAQLGTMYQQVRSFPEISARADQAYLLAMANSALKDELSIAKQSGCFHEEKVALIEQELNQLSSKNVTLEKELSHSQAKLKKIEQQWWFRLICKLFGISL